MQLEKKTFPPLAGSPLARTDAIYARMQRMAHRYRSAINANENPILISETTADNAATLDVGDINGDALWSTYRFLQLDLYAVVPVVDGDYLRILFGGEGAWWSDVQYGWASRILGLGSATSTGHSTAYIQPWPDNAVYNQGNAAGEELYGHAKIGLASGSGVTGARTMWGHFTWSESSAEHRSTWALFSAHYVTDQHLTAVRMYYGGGNISGTAQLCGLGRR